ncbi:MAG: diacylglycerol kinase family protein [Clostridia bacterium]|nr:diacylglycerol kinase family protein [Clostridia bacterium]
MKKIYVLYNPHSHSDAGESIAHALDNIYSGAELIYKNLCETEYSALFAEIDPCDDVVICGGDGTLNRFVNATAEISFENSIFYYAAGTGNDFLRDIGGENEKVPICIDKYIKDLPVTTVKGKKYRFLNNIGFGIDGYCCEVGDRMREEKHETINYTAIAIKGLLFHYKPTTATVIVDGKEYTYKKAWLAPTMKGRYYGGGMMPTPAQDRLDEEGKVSVMLLYGTGKLSTLMIFPSIFKGEHLKNKKHTVVHSGKKITVRFDAPRAVQIDGETITGVTEYTVEAGVPVRKLS